MFNFEGCKNVTIKSIEVFKEKYGLRQDEVYEYFLKIVYEYEDKYGKYELVIPKLKLDIMSNSIPLLNRKVGFLEDGAEMTTLGKTYDLKPADIDITLNDGTTKTVKNVNYIVRTIYEKKKDMTLEEIEEKLGCRINLVGKKEDKDDIRIR